MSDHTSAPDLNEASKELKEKVYSPENVWIIPDRYYLDYNLSPTQALILTIIRQTSKRRGYSEVSYSYIRKYTKQKSDNSIKSDIDFLISEKRVYRHSFMSRRGRRSKLVYPDTAGKYWSYLTACKQFGERKKFEEEFMMHLTDTPDPEDSPPSPPPSKNEPPKSASSKFEDAASSKNEDAINTTYLSNRENDVTCKGSDEPSAAASSEDLMRIELLYSYSKKEVDIAMEWYSRQTQAKKDSMKKPIACIINAIKGGYAQEEVAAANKEVAAQLQQEERVKLQEAEKKAELGTNRKLAEQLVTKFSHMNGWSHSLDSKGFSVNNLSVEKGEDTTNGCSLAYYILPDGTKCYGKNHYVRVNFDLPHQEFKKQLKDFFTQAEWTQEKERKTA